MGISASRLRRVDRVVYPCAKDPSGSGSLQDSITRARGLSNSTNQSAVQSYSSERGVLSSESSKQSRFRWENDRRFHAVEGSTYSLPNDEREMDRLTRLHFLLRWSLEGLYKAPVYDILPGAKVLDVGCGPGTWVLDMAHEYPTAELHGVDISAVYPELIHPANVHFQYGNILERLPFEDGTFDFVRQSLLIAGIPEQKWSHVMSELVRVTKKGGWIELMEMDWTPRGTGPVQMQITEKLKLGFRSRGIDVEAARHLNSIQSQAGLEEIDTNHVSIPCNWGPSKLSELMRDNVEELLWSLEPMLAKSVGIFDKERYTNDIVRPYLEEAKENESYFNYHYAYGQVPR